jgi:hypothetical protein
MGVPARVVAQPFPIAPLPDDLRRILEQLTQIAAYGDRKFLHEELPAILEDRIATLERLRGGDDAA